MDGRTEEEKEGKRLGVLPSHQKADCQQTQSRPSGTKRRSTRKRKATEKGAQQNGVRQRKTQARLVLLQAPGGYFTTPKLTETTRNTFSPSRKSISRNGKPRNVAAPVGGGVSASERWDVQWQLQRRLDECRRRCQFDIPFHFTVYAVIGKADVVVPPEPFPFSRQALDTAIELL